MKTNSLIAFLLFMSLFQFQACAQQDKSKILSDFPPVITEPTKYYELAQKEKYVILEKGTEWAFSGAFHASKEKGTYIRKQCNQPLFQSDAKFNSGTGWPSFDEYLSDSVEEVPDKDGHRTEIICSNCKGHLGHVFFGEGFTSKQTRHCVNSVSLNFVPQFSESSEEKLPDTEVQPLSEYVQGKGYEQYEQATFAGGCFWCTEASFELLRGTVDVISGYIGGEERNPSYEQVSSGKTGHAEATAIFYDPQIVSFETLLEVFFIAHDPTQLNRQGPDVGRQYRSVIFYHNKAQKNSAKAFIKKMGQSGKFSKPIVTELSPYSDFWVAERYHQDYYLNNPENPYIQKVSRPKVEKVKKTFSDLLKDQFRQ